MVHRAAGVGIGQPLRNRLPYIDFVGEIVPTGISGELLNEPEGVGADVGGLTHARNIARRRGASKRTDPAFKLPNAGFCSGRSHQMRAQRATVHARLQQASFGDTATALLPAGYHSPGTKR